MKRACQNIYSPREIEDSTTPLKNIRQGELMTNSEQSR